MIIKLKLIDMSNNINIDDIHKEIILNDVNPKDKWIDLLESNFNEFDNYNVYAIIDELMLQPIYFIEFDDFYGKVEFMIPAYRLTVEQLVNYCNNKNEIYIGMRFGGEGGGDLDPTTLQELFNSVYTIFNNIYINHPLAIDILKVGVSGVFLAMNSIIKEYDKKNTRPKSFIKYLYTKENWKIRELRKAFETKEDRYIHDIMLLSGFDYIESKKIYVKTPYQFNLSEYMKDLDYKDQVEILIYYIYSTKNYVKDDDRYFFLMSALENKISLERLQLIVRDLDNNLQQNDR